MASLDKYEVYRTTDFNEYTIVVVDDYDEEKTHLYLYVNGKADSLLMKLFTFLGSNKKGSEPVRYGILEYEDDINYGIYQLIADYELPLWQKYKAETGETYLSINHEREIRKRNKGKSNQTTVEWETTPTTYKDWEEDDTYVITSNGKMVHKNSYYSLKQNQHLRDNA